MPFGDAWPKGPIEKRPVPIHRNLPAGLVLHCEGCNLVIPADAPRPEAGVDCAAIAAARLAWFDPTATIAAQHVMAAAAWGLIHHAAVHGHGVPKHKESAAYHERIHRDRKQHFAESAARQGMTEEQVAELRKHPRDGWLVS